MPATVEANVAPMVSSTNILAPNHATASAKIVLDRIKKQLRRASQGDACRTSSPIRGRGNGPQGKLAQGAKSRFEVSLSQIPPELEQQLEFRLKKELGPQILKQAGEQSEQVLSAAKAAIDQKTTVETHGEFLRRGHTGSASGRATNPRPFDRCRSEFAGAPESWTGRASPGGYRRRQPPQANERGPSGSYGE